MKIAVIGWGSLVWDSRGLEVASEWLPDGPLLSVEFARFSSRDRLTLVLLEGVPVQQTQWAVSRKATLEDAAENLRAREGARRGGIGCWPWLEGWGRPAAVDEVVGEWAQSKGLEGVVWTALGPTRPDGSAGLAIEQERLEYLRGLVAAGREAAAREYIEMAPEQIATPFRTLVQREMGWGPSAKID